MKNNIITSFLVCEGRSNDDAEGARGTVFQEIRPGAGFKTGDFVKDMCWGGCRSKTRVPTDAASLTQKKKALTYIYNS